MKWTYVIRQKLKIALTLAVVSLIIIVTNVVDKRHYSQIQHSFDSVYKDRLLVESYIYELSGYFHRKSTLLNDGFNKNDRIVHAGLNDSIVNLLGLYEKTVLTPEEAILFGDLTTTFDQLRHAESRLAGASAGHAQQQLQHDLESTHDHLDMILNRLSGIQISETRRIVEASSRIIASSGINSQLEIVIIILFALAGQVLIFASRPLKTNFPQNSMLN